MKEKAQAVTGEGNAPRWIFNGSMIYDSLGEPICRIEAEFDFEKFGKRIANLPNLEAQRDELLAALKDISANAGFAGGHSKETKSLAGLIYNKAKAAIANAERGSK